ncbi:hypothetical protein [Stenotrophomonas sp. AB1(2024)]|uniref:hypothetical protein n=1 Tax=Stenotrophomonas sp. AB1(2024) TaxID=3132215 RepID=UPI0030959B56
MDRPYRCLGRGATVAGATVPAPWRSPFPAVAFEVVISQRQAAAVQAAFGLTVA